MTQSDRFDLDRIDASLTDALVKVCRLVADAGGRAWLVGGTVRDALLDLPTGDLDIEVFGLPAADLRAALEKEFALDLVGQSFGILKLKGLPIDVGLPRREAKIGLGHKGFEIHSDPAMDLEAAASRRDFTLNAIYADPLTGEMEDPFHGRRDLADHVLRHTSPAFDEDPLRVLRAMQFAARFRLEVASETVALCRKIEPEGLASERIYGEWVKLITLGEKPSLGLAFLDDCGWLRHFPELEALKGVPQDPKWHPEGDVWTHTLHCMDAFAEERTGDTREDLVVGFGVLCHDLGKAVSTTIGDDGKIRSHGHESSGVGLTESFLGRLTNQRNLVAEVTSLVAEHMRPTSLFQAQSSDAAVRRLAARVKRIDRLVRVARADVFGRPPLPAGDYPAGDWLLEVAAGLGLENSTPDPILLGRHLMAEGIEPGPGFGEILKRCFEAQLEGRFTDEAGGLAYLKQLLKNR